MNDSEYRMFHSFTKIFEVLFGFEEAGNYIFKSKITNAPNMRISGGKCFFREFEHYVSKKKERKKERKTTTTTTTKKRNILIYFDTNCRTEMKLATIHQHH